MITLQEISNYPQWVKIYFYILCVLLILFIIILVWNYPIKSKESNYGTESNPSPQSSNKHVFIQANGINNSIIEGNTSMGSGDFLNVKGGIYNSKITGNFVSAINFVKNPENIDIKGVSSGRKQIIAIIVQKILGVDFVINASEEEVIYAFRNVSNDIRRNILQKSLGLNSGSLLGLRQPMNIVDHKDELTTYGVSCFKKIATALKSDTH